jgi:hypothetical protein
MRQNVVMICIFYNSKKEEKQENPEFPYIDEVSKEQDNTTLIKVSNR